MPMTLQNVKAQLRSGQYVWPGGYPAFFITDDGAALCFECVRKEWRNVVASHLSIKHHAPNDGWRVCDADVNWEDPELRCEHCSKRIESAYAEPDEVTP